MASRDQDLLDGLFQVESKAEALVADARKEADARIASAKVKAEADVAAAHEGAVKEAGQKRASAEAASIAEYESAVTSFRKSLDATRVDEAAFRAACEAALAKK